MSAINARVLAVLILALAAAARAQPTEATAPRASAVACNQPQASGAYMSCALWIDDASLRRGANGDVIAIVGVFSPLPLTHVVTGDSALHYALRYERYAGTAIRFEAIGAVLMLSSGVYGRIRGCHDFLCSDRSHETGPVALAAVGLGCMFVSYPFTLIGKRASVRAIWWSNASLGR